MYISVQSKWQGMGVFAINFNLGRGLLLLVYFPKANLIPSLNCVDSGNALLQLQFAGWSSNTFKFIGLIFTQRQVFKCSLAEDGGNMFVRNISTYKNTWCDYPEYYNQTLHSFFFASSPFLLSHALCYTFSPLLCVVWPLWN